MGLKRATALSSFIAERTQPIDATHRDKPANRRHTFPPRALLAPVPLTIFRSNSKFDQILQYSSLKCILPITTKFCTRHDSVTVVKCAKLRCNQLSIV